MKFVQYGAGNIGRGFIGQVFSRAGYEVVFIDVNMDVVNKLNSDLCYPVRIVSAQGEHEEIVRNVRAVDGRDTEKVAEEISTADIMATAVGVNILPRIIPCIAEGLRRRWSKGKGALDIIICENLLDADKLMRELLKKELPSESVDELVGLVEASIGRMVPVMTQEMQQGNILRVVVEEYDQLPVDKAAFRNVIPNVTNLKPFAPFEFYIRRKLFIHNLGHAICAYLGYIKGYSAFTDVMQDSEIKLIAQRAMLESAAALSRKFNIDIKELVDHIDDLLNRFANPYLGDTVERVGRDTIRKLSLNDRLIGSAKLCDEMGVACSYIPIGIAAAMVFSPAGDEASIKLSNMAKVDALATLKEYSGISGEESFARLALEYKELLVNNDLTKILKYADEIEVTK